MVFRISRIKTRFPFLIVLAFFSFWGSVQGKDIFVSPTGNDGSNGSLRHPLGSMEGARNLIRKWKDDGPLNESVQVIFLEGDYNLVKSVVFRKEDSGTTEFPIIYKGHTSFYFTNNIVLFNRGTLLSSNWAKINLETDHNIYWDERIKDINFSHLSFSEWKAMGNDLNSEIIDPGFTAPLQHDFTFKNKSAIRKINFKPFSLDKVGVYGDKRWVQLAQFDRKKAILFEEIVRKNEGNP
ncbi:MAG: hypothetical protein WD431_14755 [Cyclobacteriaceae bacterium]